MKRLHVVKEEDSFSYEILFRAN